MIKESDLIIYPYDDLRYKAAEYIADKRLIFEYPRGGYGKYDKSHIPNIINGYLGEFAFLEFIINKFKIEFADVLNYWDEVKKKYKFSYKIIIGEYDTGFDFSLKGKIIDIKNYGTKKVAIDNILKLNLLIDKNQSAKADIYIQTFLLNDEGVCLAGYYVGIPPINNNFPKPAHACLIANLQPMNNLLNNI